MNNSKSAVAVKSAINMHPMILMRRKRKVKVFCVNGSVQNTIDDVGESLTVSMDSGLKQGDSHYIQIQGIASQTHAKSDRDVEVREMLNDGHTLGFSDSQSFDDDVDREIED